MHRLPSHFEVPWALNAHVDLDASPLQAPTDRNCVGSIALRSHLDARPSQTSNDRTALHASIALRKCRCSRPFLRIFPIQLLVESALTLTPWHLDLCAQSPPRGPRLGALTDRSLAAVSSTTRLHLSLLASLIVPLHLRLSWALAQSHHGTTAALFSLATLRTRSGRPPPSARGCSRRCRSTCGTTSRGRTTRLATSSPWTRSGPFGVS